MVGRVGAVATCGGGGGWRPVGAVRALPMRHAVACALIFLATRCDTGNNHGVFCVNCTADLAPVPILQPTPPHHLPAPTTPQGELGEKKRSKTLAALKECDVAVLVVDVARHLASPSLDVAWEKQLLEGASKYGAVPLLLYNLKGAALAAASSVLPRLQSQLDPTCAVGSLVLDLHDGRQDVAGTVASFLQEGVKSSRGKAQVGRCAGVVCACGAWWQCVRVVGR